MEKISKAQIKLIRSLQQKKFRDETGLFVAEGEKCLEELRKAFELVHLYREGENASRTEIEQMSGLKTPQGVIAVFKKPSCSEAVLQRQQSYSDSGKQLTLALDGIQDPGNLGTIIRTCDWFGVHTIVCSQDTADCYNPKVVQATMGALARVQLRYTNLPEWLSDIKHHTSDIAIYGTLLEGGNLYTKPLAQEGVIVMGNEGNGISPAVRKLITQAILIPPYKKEASEVIESLNVSIATAIVLAEFRRRG